MSKNRSGAYFIVVIEVLVGLGFAAGFVVNVMEHGFTWTLIIPLFLAAFFFFAAWGQSSTARAPEAPEAIHLPLDDGAQEMARVLDALGIPLNWGQSDPQTALVGGVAKAGIYRAHLSIARGEFDEGVKTLNTVLQTIGRESNPSWNRLAAAANYLIAKAHEMKGDRDAATAAYTESLRLVPDYLLARPELGSHAGHQREH
jgi:tetratricopeptide (TPR) repeat protein